MVKSSVNRGLRERGETQLGVILYAVGFGVLCWAIFSLEACIRTHKDSKVQKRKEQYMSRFKPKQRREVPGYSVTVK